MLSYFEMAKYMFAYSIGWLLSSLGVSMRQMGWSKMAGSIYQRGSSWLGLGYSKMPVVSGRIVLGFASGTECFGRPICQGCQNWADYSREAMTAC